MAVTRRGTLVSLGTALSGSLVGCLGDESGDEGTAEPPQPIDLSGGKQDDEGGMVIGEHAGPNGQIFYEDNSPENHDNPAWFHTLAMGLFSYHFERQRRGWNAVAVYVTDYSQTDYEMKMHDGNVLISSHTDPETFAPARTVQYVAGSDVLGGMGQELIPFSDQSDRDRFTEQYGGRSIEYGDIDTEFISEYMRQE